MKCILFCQNNYAFGILQPIKAYLDKKEHEHLWFVPDKILKDFPYKSDHYTASMEDLMTFQSDAIFVPGNEVPHYLRGLKVQVFHGLAGEKKGHFRIRHYFDLYLTQGPYFTNTFNQLKAVHKNFDVIETGWPKLDVYATNKNIFDGKKKNLLKTYKAKSILLYAPTFSPKLTSAPYLLDQLKTLAENKEYLILLKFHPLMDEKWVTIYKKLANDITNIIFEDERNIIKFLLMADLLISDTSSAIYEFILLNKPVVSFRSISQNIRWDNSLDYGELVPLAEKNLIKDPFAKQRNYIFEQFHPYNDGKSAQRMVDSVEQFINDNGVPEKRNISLLRRMKIYSIFGKPGKSQYLKVSPLRNNTSKISALMITYNEVNHIVDVIKNISFADEIIVVDSYSIDGTVEKLSELSNVKIFQRKFTNFSEQRNFAIEQASYDWILFIDADERITPALQNEIISEIDQPNAPAGFMFKRLFFFKDKRIRFSGFQTDTTYRLFKNGHVKYDNTKLVHEMPLVDGKTKVMTNKMLHYSVNNVHHYKSKMEHYAKLKALELYKKGKKATLFHFLVRPTYKFILNYFIRLGFLDGIEGLQLCYLSAYGVYIRYCELKRLTNSLPKS